MLSKIPKIMTTDPDKKDKTLQNWQYCDKK